MRTSLFALGLFFVGCALGAAKNPDRYPSFCYDEIGFTAKLVACVERSATKEEARECRAQVHRDCGIVLTSSKDWYVP